MRTPVTGFHKRVFILLLYFSAFYGIIADFLGIYDRSIFYAALDALIIVLGLTSLGALRGRLLFITCLLTICVILNLSYAQINVLASLNGLRDILVIICLVLFYERMFNYQDETAITSYVAIFRRFGYIFIALQIPAAAYQFIQNGAAGDEVGGTFGAFASGVLTMTVLCLVYFLQLHTKKWSKTFCLYLAFTPLLLNETKISFLLIPFTSFLARVDLQLKKILIAAGGAVIFFLGFNRFYTDQSVDNSNHFSDIFSEDFLNYYLVGDDSYNDIPRFTKIWMSWQLISEQTNTLFFGIEYGLFKGDDIRHSDFSRTYYWLLSGTRPYLFFLLLQGGIMLVAIFLLLLAHINRFFRRVNKFQLYLLAIFLIILLYSDILRTQAFITIYFFLVYYANSPAYLRNLQTTKNE